MEKLGFIGMGNMAQALCTGFIQSGKIAGNHVYAYAPHQDKLKKNAEEIGFTPIASVTELVNTVDTVIMACKPYQIEGVLGEIKPLLAGKALLSIAAGWPFARYKMALDACAENVRIQFVMPNTPAMVGEGVLLFEKENSLQSQERAQLMELFASTGLVQEIPSALMGIAGTLTGCGPAFVDLMIEAYGDAGVKYGLKRDEAYALISQMILGSAKLQLKTGTHPGVLKDAVCSPGGTTIRGVTALEENGFRNACIKAVEAVMEE